MMDDAVLFGDLDAPQPLRKPLRDVLLPESLLADAGGVTFHRDRPPAQMGEDHGRHGLVVGCQIALGNPVIGEEHLLGMRDHCSSLVTWRAFSISLPGRTPIRRGCRSLP